MDQLIRDEHMKHRCYFITTMCGLSLYTWSNYSLFDPITNDFFTPYYQNCLLMIFYLTWDTYNMITRPILYRTDLMIHHAVVFIVFISSKNYMSLLASNIIIMENISLLNYALRDNIRLLNLYRTACILFVRLPLTIWVFIYYNPNIIIPHLYKTVTTVEYYYLYFILKLQTFFILYDMFILWKLYSPGKKKQV